MDETKPFAVLVLAAGRSSRMGGRNKLLEPVGGLPMAARVADAALASRACRVIVVTGHQAEAVEAALAGRPLRFVRNPDFAEGMSTSLRAGVSALPAEAEAVAVCLGDMPLVRAATIDALAAAFDPTAGRAICVPVCEGRRGNPILWGRRFFAEMAASTGDAGARRLLARYPALVHEVPVESPEIFMDVDTVGALDALEPPA